MQKRIYFFALITGGISLLLTFILALLVGTSDIGLKEVGEYLYDLWSNQTEDQEDTIVLTGEIVFNIRFPRVLCGYLIGVGLSISGVLMQAFFRNPLAEPAIIGVSSGGAFGAVIAIFTGLESVWFYSLPLLSFFASLITVVAVYMISLSRGRIDSYRMILTGVAISTFISALISLMLILKLGSVESTTRILFWLMGGLESRRWDHLIMILPFIVVGTTIAFYISREMDILLLGDTLSSSVGVPVVLIRRLSLLAVALMTGAAVAVSGIIGFVGLVIPHILRLIVGPYNKRLIVLSFLWGGVYVMLMDVLVRALSPDFPIRLGIISSLLGGPFFLYLLLRKSS